MLSFQMGITCRFKRKLWTVSYHSLEDLFVFFFSREVYVSELISLLGQHKKLLAFLCVSPATNLF